LVLAVRVVKPDGGWQGVGLAESNGSLLPGLGLCMCVAEGQVGGGGSQPLG